LGGSSFDPDKTRVLLELIDQLAIERGITIPPGDPYPEQQDVYERFLKSMGLEPDRVDRILDFGRIPEDQHGVIHGMILHAILNQKSIGDDELKALLFLVRTIFSEQRASVLLRKISSPILENARRTSPALRQPIALGVFPWRWFNGHSFLYENTSLCLVSTGSMDLVEVFTTLFMARQKDQKYAVENMRKAIKQYVRTGEVASAEYGLAKGLVDFGDYGGIGTRLTTAAEQFLISHELAHVALGHINDLQRGGPPAQAKSSEAHGLSGLTNYSVNSSQAKAISVVQPKHSDEHCADVWGMMALLAVANQHNHEGEMALFCGGAAAFLGLLLLIEAASDAVGGDTKDSHPPALNRLYIVELAFELLKQHENAFLARRVREFVEEVGIVYSGFEMPPLLSRPLNGIAISVFEQLGIDLSEAPYITNFQ
jgi:hypothetical protein